jgi:transcriptional regulator with XRE-family HTH domain
MNAKWFAGRLRELRIAAGLSHKELADKAGINKDSLSRLELERWQPTWATIVALCKALGATPNDFIIPPAPAEKKPRGRPAKQ